MIIVLATVKVLSGSMRQALELSTEHVARSRQEPGCLSHAVLQDTGQPDHLFFVEEWESEEALKNHIAVPATAEFVNELITMAVGRPSFRLFSASEMPFPHTSAA